MQAKKLALGGIIAALTLVVMLLGGLIGIGTYAAPLLAGILLEPIGRRLGIRMHLAILLAVTLLSAILVPDVEETLIFLFFFGWYPLLRPSLAKLSAGLAIATKLLLFNVCIILAEVLLYTLFLPLADTAWMLLALLCLANIVFFLYDKALPRFTLLMEQLLQRIRKG